MGQGDPPGLLWTRLLAWILAGVLLLAFAWVGAVDAGVRVGLHVGVAIALALATQLPRAQLASATNRLLAIAGVSCALGLALGGALVPLGPGTVGWLAPGVLAAAPEQTWWTAGLSAEDGFGALALLGLVSGSAAVAAAWGAQQRDSEPLGRAVLGAVLGLCVVGAVHAALGLQAAFGWVATTQTAAGPFFGPLVNPNHVGSVLLLGWPLALRRGVDRGLEAPLALGLCAAIPAMLLATGAGGPALIAVGLAAVEAVRRRRFELILGLALVVPLIAVLERTDAEKADTLAGRLVIWRDALAALGDHWLFGVGAGAYLEGVEPYRTDRWRANIAHAHNDWLEWVVETGLVGAVMLGLAALVAWRWRPRELDDTGQALLLGVAGVAIHGVIDFPLAIPAIAMSCAAVLGACAARGPRVRGAAGRAAVVIWALAAANLAGAGLCWQRSEADRAEQAVKHWSSAPERAARAADDLAWWAPWRGWDRLQAAWTAQHAGDRERALREARATVALRPDDDELLRPAALVIARAGALEEAAAVAERARVRGDVDYRNHVAIARIALARGDLDGAADAYVAAFERDAPYVHVREAWEARPLAVFWIQKLESTPDHLTALAVLLTSRADPEEALLAFDVAALGRPGVPEHPIRSLALARSGRIEAALERAEARAEWGEPEAVRVLGEVRELAGDAAGAVAAWERVEEEYPMVRGWMVRAEGRLVGPEAGLSRVERYRMAGQWTPLIGLWEARLHAHRGDGPACRQAVEALDGEPEQGAAAQACRGLGGSAVERAGVPK